MITKFGGHGGNRTLNSRVQAECFPVRTTRPHRMAPTPRFGLGLPSLTVKWTTVILDRNNGANGAIRTPDLKFTKLLLYQLSYAGKKSCAAFVRKSATMSKRSLYPASSLAPAVHVKVCSACRVKHTPSKSRSLFSNFESRLFTFELYCDELLN